jgi:hypothetical protein
MMMTQYNLWIMTLAWPRRVRTTGRSHCAAASAHMLPRTARPQAHSAHADCPPPAAAHTAAKSRVREVKARYLQPRPTPAHPSATGARLPPAHARAHHHSAGWMELQLPSSHGEAPVMVHTGSLGAPMHTGSRPAPSARRQCGGAPLATPAAAAPHTASGTQGRARGVGIMSASTRTGGPSLPLQQRTGPGDVLPEPDSIRRPVFKGELQTPMAPGARLGASLGGSDMLHEATAGRPALTGGRLAAASVDVGSMLHTGSRTVDRGAEERRAALEAFRQQKRSLAAAREAGRAAARSAGGAVTAFKEPPPRTLFKATAASIAGSTARTAAATAAASGGGGVAAAAFAARPPPSVASSCTSSIAPPSRGPSCGGAPVTEPQPAPGTQQQPAPGTPPGSAFSATMAALQQPAGSGGRSGGRGAGMRGARPAGVPLLQIERLTSPRW